MRNKKLRIKEPAFEKRLLKKHEIEEIKKCKKAFLENGVDPHQCPYLKPEIADSWIRSYQAGVDPYFVNYEIIVDSNTLEKRRQKNRQLIEITRNFFDIFQQLAINYSFHLHLDDCDGFPLLQEGDSFPYYHRSFYGRVNAERLVGTNSHTLCTALKRPVQLIGPEHYNERLAEVVASSAPILNEHDEVIATLTLWSPIKAPWELETSILLSHTFGLITAIASAISSKLALQKSYDDLKTTYGTLRIALALIDSGIVVVDDCNQISSLNKVASEILKVSDLEGRNLADFVTEDSKIIPAIRSGKHMELEETIIDNHKKEATYFITAFPIVSNNNSINGAVLKLDPIYKINKLSANRAGTRANIRFKDLIGSSKQFKETVNLAKKFAVSSENILLIGESGTGKELFAHAIHNYSNPNGPFIAINCAALPRSLIESELFGYESGSFTGAQQGGKPGKIELAHGGTLFLDEIGDMPFELQAVLLRVLQDKQVMRIGGQKYKKVDFRLITATNKDLLKMVKNNQFREDLYYRLSVLSMRLPPLRERREDIETLSKYFLNNYCYKMGWKIPSINPDALQMICEYDWPGNVRQLENAIIYAVNTSKGNIIGIKNLPQEILTDNCIDKLTMTKTENKINQKETLTLKEIEKEAIKTALATSRFNIPNTAKALGISKSTLYRKLREYQIKY